MSDRQNSSADYNNPSELQCSDATESNTTLRDRMSGLMHGMSRGNVNIVKKVERMMKAQQSEIDVLTTRIANLNKQIDRQKSYYGKRESIIREMYEGEIQLISEETLKLTDNDSISSRYGSIRCDAKTNLKPEVLLTGSCLVMDSKSTSSSEYTTQREVKMSQVTMTTGLSNTNKSQQQQGVTEAGTEMSPIRCHVSDVACETSPVVSSVTRGIQNSLGASTDSMGDALDHNDDFKTCVDSSPLVKIAQTYNNQIDKELQDDFALQETIRLHECTQSLYSKLDHMLLQAGPTISLTSCRPHHKHDRHKPTSKSKRHQHSDIKRVSRQLSVDKHMACKKPGDKDKAQLVTRVNGKIPEAPVLRMARRRSSQCDMTVNSELSSLLSDGKLDTP